MGLSCQTSKRWKHVAFESVLLAWHTCLLSLSWIWPKISLLFPGKNMSMLQSNPAGMRSCVHLIGIMCFNKPSNKWIYEPKWTVLSLSSFCRVAPLLWAPKGPPSPPTFSAASEHAKLLLPNRLPLTTSHFKVFVAGEQNSWNWLY